MKNCSKTFPNLKSRKSATTKALNKMHFARDTFSSSSEDSEIILFGDKQGQSNVIGAHLLHGEWAASGSDENELSYVPKFSLRKMPPLLEAGLETTPNFEWPTKQEFDAMSNHTLVRVQSLTFESVAGEIACIKVTLTDEFETYESRVLEFKNC